MMRKFAMISCFVMLLVCSVKAEDAKPAQTEPTPQVVTPIKATFDDFQSVMDVNIFIRRKPVSKNKPSANNQIKPVETAAPPPPVNTYLLCGIIIENDDRFTAMIEDSQTHTLRSLHIGDKLDVFEIPSMSISSINLNLPGGSSAELFIGQTIDANGHILQTSWIPTANSATPGSPGNSGSSSAASSDAPPSEKELSILEKLRRKRESQLKKE